MPQLLQQQEPYHLDERVSGPTSDASQRPFYFLIKSIEGAEEHGLESQWEGKKGVHTLRKTVNSHI